MKRDDLLKILTEEELKKYIGDYLNKKDTFTWEGFIKYLIPILRDAKLEEILKKD